MFKLIQIIVLVVVISAGVTWFAKGRQQKSELTGEIADAVQTSHQKNAGNNTATAILAGGCFW